MTTAFIVSGLVVLTIGESPVEAIASLLYGALGTREGIGFTLYYATNFIFTGLAVAVAFHAGLFNIGGEGQAMMGGIGSAIICLALEPLPGILLVPLGILGGAAAGAVWAFIPGWLEAKRGSHVVITTIMFNFLASTLIIYLLVNVFRPQGSMSPESRAFAKHAVIPQMHDVLAWFGMKMPATPLNLSFFLALVCAAAVWLLLWRTRLGYEIRVVGASPTAAAYAGISTQRIIMVTMAISGGLAGLLAVNEVMGVQQKLLSQFTAGYGFVGIAVALMGRSHPFGVCLAALLFGILYQGGTELAFDKPKITRDMIVVIQGFVILFAGALEHAFERPLALLFSRKTLNAAA